MGGEKEESACVACSLNVLLDTTLGSPLDSTNSACSKMNSSGYMGRCEKENVAISDL